VYKKAKSKGKCQFSIKPTGGRKVHIAADFTNWKPVPLIKQKDGMFVADFTLPTGMYQYKFIVDGQWCCDPDNSIHAANPFGTTNSIAQV